MALVADYGSDVSSGSEDALREDEQRNPALPATNDDEASTSQDSYFVGSATESEDSATRRRREAEERLTNREEEVTGPSSSLALPPPLAIIDGTKQPDFLKPEATRPLAKPFHRSRQPLAKAEQPQPAKQESGARDIASMAPRLKGESEAEKRGLPAGAVISAAAKKYKPEDTGMVVTAAQVAMLGGQWKPSAESEAPEQQKQQKKKGPSAAMPVSDFLAKGDGGSLLPRNKQDRRDREKEKRSRGQSSIHGWKTEAEMVLRQQYD